MSVEQNNSNGEALTFKVMVGGADLTEQADILSVSIRRQFSKIPTAEVVIYYGSLMNNKYVDDGNPAIGVGSELEIYADPEGEECLFSGQIVKKGVSLNNRRAYMTLTARNKAFRMTQSRHNCVFTDKTDSDIIADLIDRYGLKSDVESTSYQHETVTQYNSTDWDMINLKAEANGMLVLVTNEGIEVHRPALGSPVLDVVGYELIVSFDAQLDGSSAFSSYKATSWNYNSQECQEVEQQNAGGEFTQGSEQPKELAEKLGNDPLNLCFNSSFTDSDVVTDKLNSTMMRNNLSRIVGKVRLYGSYDIKPGDTVSFSGIGESFNGDALVSEVCLEYAEGAWNTILGFGMEETPYYWAYDNINAAPASELIPATHGLQIGKVVALEGDPMDDFRIKVSLPCFDGDTPEVWARLATVDAGDKRGYFFVPEINDEVVIGFIDQNPGNPIVLGALHSNKLPSPQELTDDNNLKGLYLKSGIKLEFNEEDKVVLLETPGGNKLCLNDKDGKIEIADQNGNQIVMDNQGITLKSAGKVAIEASQDMTQKGVNVTVEASAQLKASGSAQTEVSSSGIMVVKGSLVQIN